MQADRETFPCCNARPWRWEMKNGRLRNVDSYLNKTGWEPPNKGGWGAFLPVEEETKACLRFRTRREGRRIRGEEESREQARCRFPLTELDRSGSLYLQTLLSLTAHTSKGYKGVCSRYFELLFTLMVQRPWWTISRLMELFVGVPTVNRCVSHGKIKKTVLTKRPAIDLRICLLGYTSR